MADEEEKIDTINPKGGSKKLLFIGLLAGLIVGGGGAAGALIFLQGEEGVEEEPAEVHEVNPAEVPHFVKVEKVTLPMIYKDRVLANVQLDFSLEVEGNDNKMILIRSLPEIRDALLRHYSVNSIGKADSPRNVDYLELKKTMLKISNEILHKDMVKRIMIVQARHF